MSARSLKVEMSDTSANKNKKQTCRSTVKIKLEDSVNEESLSVLATVGAKTSRKTQSWITTPRDTLSFSGSDIPLSRGRRARISDGNVPPSRQTKSCEGDLHAPHSSSSGSRILRRVSSRSTPDTPSPTRDARNPPRLIVEDIDDPGIAVSNSGSPISPESDSSDDDNQVFDTPQPKSLQSYDLSTPLTPPSVYKPRGSFLGNESPSPTGRKPRRPAPRRFPHLEKKSKIKSGCRPIRKQEDQDGDGFEDTSTESPILDEAPTERKIAAVVAAVEEEVTECGDEAVEVERDDSRVADDTLEHETCSDAPSVITAVNKATSSVNGIDVFRDIFGNDMTTLIEEKRNHCYGLKKNGALCANPLAKAKAESIRRWRQDAHRPLPLPTLVEELQGLVETVFCFHHIGKAKTKAVSWFLSQGVSSPAPKDYEDSPCVGTERRKKDTKKAMEEAIKRAVTGDFIFFQPSSGENGSVEGIIQCTPWQPKNTQNVGVKQSLAMWVVKSLVPRDEKPGFLYVFSNSGDSKSRKIGVTTRNIGTRLRKWRADCKLEVNQIYPKDGKQVPINHVFRLEKLVHTELKDYRITKKCTCTKTHIEWSTAPEALILAVIGKWVAWLDSKPYEKHGENWQLEGGFRTLEDVCTPCSAPSVAVPSQLSTPNLAKTLTTRSLRSQDDRNTKLECGQIGTAA